MDQHHAEHRLARERDQDLGEPRELLAAEPAGRHERAGRHRGGQADDRERAAPAHERERRVPPRQRGSGPRACSRPSAARRIRPCGGCRRRDCPARASRRSGVPTCASQRAAAANSASSEMFTRSPVTAMWSGLLRVHVAHDRVEHVGAVMAVALAVPVDQPEPALVGELGQARRRDRSEMRIGQVGEHEHRPDYQDSTAKNNGARSGSAVSAATRGRKLPPRVLRERQLFIIGTRAAATCGSRRSSAGAQT